MALMKNSGNARELYSSVALYFMNKRRCVALYFMNKRRYLIKMLVLCHHWTCIVQLALIRCHQRPSANTEMHGLDIDSLFNSSAGELRYIRHTFVLDIIDTKEV